MKNYTLFVLLIGFFGCTNKPDKPVVIPIHYTGFSETRVVLVGVKGDNHFKLTDTLGEVAIKLPLRLDSFYTWNNTSDCLGCGDIRYRFADKHYQHFMESGFLWNKNRPDSVYQFTIVNNEVKQASDTFKIPSITINDTILWDYLVGKLTGGLNIDTPHFIRKDYSDINGRPFVITAFVADYGYLTENKTLFVAACTNIKSRSVNEVCRRM